MPGKSVLAADADEFSTNDSIVARIFPFPWIRPRR
jgi:hypothetical protein